MSNKKVLDGPFDPLMLGTIEDDDDIPVVDDDDDEEDGVELAQIEAPTAKTTVVVKGHKVSIQLCFSNRSFQRIKTLRLL